MNTFKSLLLAAANAWATFVGICWALFVVGMLLEVSVDEYLSVLESLTAIAVFAMWPSFLVWLFAAFLPRK